MGFGAHDGRIEQRIGGVCGGGDWVCIGGNGYGRIAADTGVVLRDCGIQAVATVS